MSNTLPAKTDSIYVAGHGGLVGSALVRRLKVDGFENLVTAGRSELDLRNQAQVNDFFQETKPKFVFLVAGTVGGILANSTRPAEFLFDNMMIHANVIDAAYRNDVTKLLYLGSSCIYPRMATQPIVEEELLTGPLEPTNEAYALAKISGIKLCNAYRTQYGCNFISAMPTNLYGPNDNFDLSSSHVLPALIRRFHDAKTGGTNSVEIWGSGSPLREFLHVDDLADACLFLLREYSGTSHINIGTGQDVSIRTLAQMIQHVVFPEATVTFDDSKPDGTPRKVLNVDRIAELGWQSKISLTDGIKQTYEWFLEQLAQGTALRGVARQHD